MPAKPTATSPGSIVAALVVLLPLVQRPISAPDLWWHLARGRAVLAGSLTPARDLLILESKGEADWLGGVPFYVLHSMAGNILLAAVPLLAAAGLVLLAGRHLPRDAAGWPQAARPAILLMLPLLLWTVRDGLQPVPALFDLAGMLVLWRLLRADWTQLPLTAAVGLTFAVWSNLGPRPVWGLLVVVMLCPRERFQLRLVTAAVIGGCLTPRGLWGWIDSAVLFAPALWSSGGSAWPSEWTGIFSPLKTDWPTLGFLVLWPMWVVGSWPLRSEPTRALRWSIPLLAAILSRSNLPACGMWMLLDVCQSPGQLTWLKRLSARRWILPLGAIAGALIVVDAAGRGLPPYGRLGAGIAHQLDYRLLDSSFVTATDETLTAWGMDGRSVGTVLWTLPRVRMLDHPQRALLGGRWGWHLNLRNDILSAHRAAYRRDDGTWGGFVQQLAEWKADLLFIPMEDVTMNRALVETPWKPVDLDSPTVPYVDADRTSSPEMIVEVMRQQAFVEVGPWQPTVEIYAPQGWRWDALEAVGWDVNPAPAIRQSHLFRGLEIPMASLRALLPVRQQTTSEHLWREFAWCQEHLGYQEWFTFGQSSQFRRRLVQQLDPQVAERADWAQVDSQEELSLRDNAWSEAISLYLAGKLPAAAERLQSGDSHQQYAAAMIWLESGDPLRARQTLARLKAVTSDAALTIAADYWTRQIDEFERGDLLQQAATRGRPL